MRLLLHFQHIVLESLNVGEPLGVAYRCQITEKHSMISVKSMEMFLQKSSILKINLQCLYLRKLKLLKAIFKLHTSMKWLAFYN